MGPIENTKIKYFMVWWERNEWGRGDGVTAVKCPDPEVEMPREAMEISRYGDGFDYNLKSKKIRKMSNNNKSQNKIKS